jgi:FkbM family methyltransferase
MSTSVLNRCLVRGAGSRRLRALGVGAIRIPGVGNLLRWLAHQRLPKGNRVWVQIPSGAAQGLWLKLDPYLERGYFTGCPEPGVQEVIAAHLKPGGCFYDVGAHIGFYALLAARVVGEQGTVVAFEPDPANVEVLRDNLARNNMIQTDVITSAVWSSRGRVNFQRDGSDQGAKSSRRGAVIAAEFPPPNANLIEVEAITLDEYAQNGPRPTLIKVDVEGGEAEVLIGAERLIAETKPVWLIEVHHQEAASCLEARFSSRGYSLVWLPGHPGFPFPRHLLARPGRPSGN